jgi:uncharacterized protein
MVTIVTMVKIMGCLAPVLRLCPPAVAGVALCCALLSAASAEVLSERGVVTLMTDGDGGSIEIAQDLAGVLDDGSTRRLLPVAGHGGVRDLIDLKALRDLDVAIVTTDALDIAKKPNIQAEVDKLTYIAKLYNEELHVLARAHIKSVSDLSGRRVNFDGAAVLSGPTLFGLLRIDVQPTFLSPALALAKLRSGEIAAIAYIAPKPTPRFAALSDVDGFHFLTVPFKPELAAGYAPARLTATDYPHLVPPDAPVDTVAVGAVMVAASMPHNSERYRNVSNLVEAFFTQFSELQQSYHHPKWAEVNLSAEVPGWTRFPPAEAWLKRNTVARSDDELRDSFAKFLDERTRLSGGGSLSMREKEQLFDQFRRWKSSQQ